MNGKVLELMKLVEENPTLKVIPIVDSDVVAGDDFQWWTGEFGNPSIDEIYIKDEETYLRSQSEEQLVEEIAATMEFTKDVHEKFAIKQAEKEVSGFPWEKVITIKITV